MIATCLSLAACSGPGLQVRVTPPSPAASTSAGPSLRTPSAPPGLQVDNAALGGSHDEVARAIRDLKDAGLWHRLTGHLYFVKISSRPGREEVPEDGHLADVYLRGYIDDAGQGAMCDVLFFPAALRDDLRNWADAHARGLIGPPPTERAYWAAVLAHELAHCLGHGRGEEVAREWEERALRLLGQR